MEKYIQGAKVIYIRQSPYIMIGKSLFAICRLCGEPVDDRQKKSARLHKRCADALSAIYRKRFYSRKVGLPA
jgi:hypothetical protein